MMDLLEEMAAQVTEHDNALDQVYDELETLDQDLDDVVSDIYADEDEDDEEDAEDDSTMYEVTCPNCGQISTLDEETLMDPEGDLSARTAARPSTSSLKHRGRLCRGDRQAGPLSSKSPFCRGGCPSSARPVLTSSAKAPQPFGCGALCFVRGRGDAYFFRNAPCSMMSPKDSALYRPTLLPGGQCALAGACSRRWKAARCGPCRPRRRRFPSWSRAPAGRQRTGPSSSRSKYRCRSAPAGGPYRSVSGYKPYLKPSFSLVNTLL